MMRKKNINLNKKIDFVIVISFLFFLSVNSFPQDGHLDPTFGTNGIVTTPFYIQGSGSINSLAMQPDGKIVAAGIYDPNGTFQYSCAFTRYNTDGSQDLSFGKLGYTFINTSTSTSKTNSIQIMPDNSIVSVGSAIVSGHNQFSVVYLDSAGSPNSAIGLANIPIGSYDAEANAVAVQSDGKIVAAGYAEEGTAGSIKVFAIERLSGFTPDASFGTNGMDTVSIFQSSLSIANAVAIQSDGKILVAGYYYNGHNYDFALVRLRDDGLLDTGFGMNITGLVRVAGGGIVRTQVGTGSDVATSIAVQSDGKILLAGYSDVGYQTEFALVRYKVNGIVDSTFGTNGIVTTPVGTYARAKYVGIRNDGKIIVAGSSNDGTSKNSFAVVCYNSDGSINNSFGTDGISINTVGTTNSDCNSAILQPDGKVVTGGDFSNASQTDYDFALSRISSTGDLDNSFGESGDVMTQVGTPSAAGAVMAIQNDGKILLGGSMGANNYFDFALARYNVDGSLDNSFGESGIDTTYMNGFGIITGVALQVDGKIVVSGYSLSGAYYNFSAARYDSDGTLDNTFGTNGIVITPVGSENDYTTSMAIQSNGKILVAGYTLSGTNSDFSIIRYNTNGTPDNTFGTNNDGIVTTSINGNDICNSMVVQSDGKIILAGTTNNNQTVCLVRYNSDGTLDKTWGANGIDTTEIINGTQNVYSIVIQKRWENCCRRRLSK